MYKLTPKIKMAKIYPLPHCLVLDLALKTETAVVFKTKQGLLDNGDISIYLETNKIVFLHIKINL